ncbi:hypothetical protein [Longimicrobium sp.]|uniref:hypothetical protein n=1 Tax=Longimicrobium sp. TaxID=2029185 RepID=UPI003B3A5192
MSLVAFQRAICDMAARPALCRRLLDEGAVVLAGYDLTPIEVQRLLSAADQRGMRMNCMLYRNGRLSPLVSQLPGTFHLLGFGLREVAEAFWVENPKVPRGVPGEMRRFAAFLRRRMAQGALREPLLGEVLDWEMETYELALLPPERTRASVAEAAERARPDAPLRPHPLVGVARFSREPFAVVRALAEKRPPPYDHAQPGEYHVLVDFRGVQRALTPLDASVAAAFRALRAGESLAPESAAPLVEQGLAVAA